MPFAKMAAAASLREGKQQPPSLQRATGFPYGRPRWLRLLQWAVVNGSGSGQRWIAAVEATTVQATMVEAAMDGREGRGIGLMLAGWTMFVVSGGQEMEGTGEGAQTVGRAQFCFSFKIPSALTDHFGGSSPSLICTSI